ncbi:MAG: gamma-glutamyltransferase [Acidobacteria bacterium]|nr:gamma-glutamyltransferase [Acidobacteriota bacterium]
MTRHRYALVVLALVTLAGCKAAPPPAASTPPVAAPVVPAVPDGWPHALTTPAAEGEHGMVVADQALATEVGVAVLRDGGNAVDAAVATAFALAVVLPSAGNIGGGGFMVAYVGGQSYALDFRETAPAAASRNMYLDARGETGDRSVTGHLASGVPGSVAGLWAAHQKLGSKPWAALIAPAIRLAEEGFEVDDYAAGVITAEADRLRRFPASAALYTPGGQPLARGARLRNLELARTLERIADGGRDGFYKGETASLLLAEMKRGKGIITAADLDGYEPKWRTPITFQYRGHDIISMPPPSSGGITLALIAQQLSAYDLAGLGWHSAPSVHLMAESMRRAFAVRNEVIADPDFVTFDQAELLSPAFSEGLRRTISTERATPSSEVTGRPAPAESRQTTHFSVADGAGNAVALTTTINGWYGSAVTVAGAGFLLNNEMDDFAAKPGTPNMYGLVQGESNAIAPGKRMLSAMTPTIVLGSGKQPVLVTGASGGPFIITTTFQAISNYLDYRLGVSALMRAPRMHHQHLPDALLLEDGGFSAADIAALRRLGHDVKFFAEVDGGSIGATIERRSGHWLGQSDPRLTGLAKGY